MRFASFYFLLSAVIGFANTSSAKLGEDLPALIKRFGNNYRSVPAGRYAEQRYEFRSGNFSVDVDVSNGRSVAELYYGDHKLVTGRPPENIWRALLEKNVPRMTWLPDGHGGFVSWDRRYVSWFHIDTTVLPTTATYAIGISDLQDSGQEAMATKAARVQPPAGPVVAIPSTAPSQVSRDALLDNFLDTVGRCYPSLNGIQHFAGSDFVAVHPFFSQYTFAMGTPAREIAAWVNAHRADLDRFGVKKVGVSSPEGSEAYFELQPSSQPVMRSQGRLIY